MKLDGFKGEILYYTLKDGLAVEVGELKKGRLYNWILTDGKWKVKYIRKPDGSYMKGG